MSRSSRTGGGESTKDLLTEIRDYAKEIYEILHLRMGVTLEEAVGPEAAAHMRSKRGGARVTRRQRGGASRSRTRSASRSSSRFAQPAPLASRSKSRSPVPVRIPTIEELSAMTSEQRTKLFKRLPRKVRQQLIQRLLALSQMTPGSAERLSD